jgi:uncharacterized membrane protein YeaQ/YmgE (transglycosylase-associated protein family)
MDQQKTQNILCNSNIILEIKMNLLIYLVVAAIIGWVATEIMHDRSNLVINIIVAVVGAFIAGYFLSPIFHVGTINDAFTIPTMLVTLLGSVILLAIVHLFQRGRH